MKGLHLSVGVLLAALLVASVAAADLHPWGKNAMDYRGRDGARITFGCPAVDSFSFLGHYGSVFGTDVYTDGSSVCMAAVHAGLITKSGGSVMIEIRAYTGPYRGSTRYGVTSKNWRSWGGSFIFLRHGRGKLIPPTVISPANRSSYDMRFPIPFKWKEAYAQGRPVVHELRLFHWDPAMKSWSGPSRFGQYMGTEFSMRLYKRGYYAWMIAAHDHHEWVYSGWGMFSVY
jgi:hypothetical protein